MVFCLLSPSKTLKFDPVANGLDTTQPFFQKDAAKIAGVLKDYDTKKLAKLMALSPKLAELNVTRFQDFKTKPTAKTEQAPAILAYRGDTYLGLDADTLTPTQMKYAQDHLGIITGLYGVVQPLDLIQPYRLEMGTALAVDSHKDLYRYWQGKITTRINALVKQSKAKIVVGAVSQEYLKAVDTDALDVPFINCDFKEDKGGKFQTIGLFAKKARGMMARYCVTEKIKDAEGLKNFNLGGYKFNAKLSTDSLFVFTRKA